MQFSIRRPKLPSSETHPEESAHRRLDVPAWLGHLNELGQVEEEHKLRKVRLARAAAPCAERCPPRAPGPAERPKPRAGLGSRDRDRSASNSRD